MAGEAGAVGVDFLAQPEKIKENMKIVKTINKLKARGLAEGAAGLWPAWPAWPASTPASEAPAKIGPAEGSLFTNPCFSEEFSKSKLSSKTSPAKEEPGQKRPSPLGPAASSFWRLIISAYFQNQLKLPPFQPNPA
jgi:hypothetical protein